MSRNNDMTPAEKEERRALLALARIVHEFIGTDPGDWRDAEAWIRRLAREAIEAVEAADREVKANA